PNNGPQGDPPNAPGSGSPSDSK
ncbi:unnamed protein product, partial [Adineta steineri]